MRHILRRTGLFFLAGGLTTLLVGPFLIPVPALKGTFSTRELADEDSEFIRINGIELHVKRMGQGKPVFILLHGMAASLYTFHAVMEPLSQLGTVIAYDRPGFGLSERPMEWTGKNPYSPEVQVELVIGLMDYFKAEKAILVGSSAGGTVSMQTALSYPERISALILVDPAVYVGRRITPGIQYLLATPQMRHLGPLISRQVLKRGPRLLDLSWNDPSRIPAGIWEKYEKPFKVENWDRALWEFALATHRNDLPEHLNELTLPSLVVTGDNDRIIQTADSIRLASELPNASLKVIEKSGHLPHEEQPQVFMEAVAAFMKTLQL